MRVRNALERADETSWSVSLTTYHSQSFSAPLSAFVESVWLYDGTPPAHTIERRLPDGMLSLIFNVRDDEIRMRAPHDPAKIRRYPGALLTGARTSFAMLDTTTAISVLGVQFKPGAASAFLPWPVDEIQDSEAPLDLVWGAEALDLRARLSTESSHTRRFDLVERFLRTRFNPEWTPHAAVVLALSQLHAAHGPSIAQVSDQLALSRTRFNQVFRSAVGLSPKQYQRVWRFQSALRLLERSWEGQRSVRWSEIAATCGFYDQAHLTREFHLCAGMTPGAYLRQRGWQRNHVPASF
jgi:AraC-like DNA-binding protein